MKKNISLLFVAMQCSLVYSMSDFAKDVSKSSRMLFESKNYDAKYVNEDGSVSIIGPKFSDPQGSGNLYISQNSDMNGLCKLFGLGAYIANSSNIFNQGSTGYVVRINLLGRFQQFDTSSGTNAIKSFSCVSSSGYPPVVSTNFDRKSTNDDGSVVVLKPKFMINGSSQYISQLSSLDGVCSLFGLGNVVPNSTTIFNQGSTGTVVRINTVARFSQFDSNSGTNAISAISCFAKDPTTPEYSRNYENIFENEDKSISIIRPKFFIDGSNEWVSQLSDLNGLCKIYGLGMIVPNSYSVFNQGSTGRVVRLNYSGNFQQFDANSGTNAVNAFSCRPLVEKEFVSSSNFERKVQNDDGTTTIIKPKFAIDGATYWLSENSNLSGVCKLYGYIAYVSNSLNIFNQGSTGKVVRVNELSRFAQFDANSGTNAISSLICE